MNRFTLLTVLSFCLINCTGQPPKPIPNTPISQSPTLVIPQYTNTPIPQTLTTPISQSTPPQHTKTPLPNTPIPTSALPPFPIYQGATLNPDLVGIQIHLRDEELDWLFDHLTALGVGWVKVQVSWKLYEPAPKEFHSERFAELDAFIEEANALGIKVMLGISKAPEWSRPTTEMDGPPTEFAHFQSFTAYLATRYQGQVAAYELWNEPNLLREWNGRSLSGADFVSLIRLGAAGIRQFDNEAILISGAPATTGINDGVTAVDDRVYLQTMLESGVGEFVDGIGAHPYGAANPPRSSFLTPSSVTSSHNNHPSFFFIDTLNDYQSLLAKAGVSKQIWVTEFGWGTFEDISPTVPAGVEFMAETNEWQQAEYVGQAFELSQTESVFGPMMLWNLNFAPLLGQDFSESGYSILATDGTPRPAYLTLQQALKLQ